MPLRFALCHLLEGSGLKAVFHLVGGDGAAQRPLLVIGTSAAAQFTTQTYPWPPPTLPGAPAAPADFATTDTPIAWLQKTIDAMAWVEEGAQIESDSRFFRVRQSLEVLHDINEQMPRLWNFWNGYRLAPRVPLMPVLIIPATRE
jgi:hypothetical protein